MEGAEGKSCLNQQGSPLAGSERCVHASCPPLAMPWARAACSSFEVGAAVLCHTHTPFNPFKDFPGLLKFTLPNRNPWLSSCSRCYVPIYPKFLSGISDLSSTTTLTSSFLANTHLSPIQHGLESHQAQVRGSGRQVIDAQLNASCLR